MSTTGQTLLVAMLAIVTFALRGAGVAAPRLATTVSKRAAGLAPALLGALVVVNLTNDDGILAFDPRLAGVAAAAILAWRRAPFIACVLTGAIVAGLLRLTQ